MSGVSVVHVVPAAPFGGLQRAALTLAAEQRRRGHAAVMAASGAGAELAAAARAEGVPLHGGTEERHRLADAVGLGRALSRARPAILHVHATTPRIAGAVAIGSRRPLVLHLHLHPGRDRRTADRLATRLLRTRAECVVAVSRRVAESARRQGFAPVTIVPNAIPDHAFAKARTRRRTPPVFGMAARLVEGKGLDSFLLAAARIRLGLGDATFAIAGDGPLMPQVRDRIRTAGLDGFVALPGHVSDMAGFWRGVDVSLFLCRDETFGLGLVESVAAGVPTIAWTNGSGSDDVLSACPAILRRPHGDVEGAAGLAVALATRQALYAEASRRGIAQVATAYSSAAVAARIEALYDEILDARLPARGGLRSA